MLYTNICKDREFIINASDLNSLEESFSSGLLFSQELLKSRSSETGMKRRNFSRSACYSLFGFMIIPMDQTGENPGLYYHQKAKTIRFFSHSITNVSIFFGTNATSLTAIQPEKRWNRALRMRNKRKIAYENKSMTQMKRKKRTAVSLKRMKNRAKDQHDKLTEKSRAVDTCESFAAGTKSLI